MFGNSLEIVEECGLTHLHVFPFSPREGHAGRAHAAASARESSRSAPRGCAPPATAPIAAASRLRSPARASRSWSSARPRPHGGLHACRTRCGAPGEIVEATITGHDGAAPHRRAACRCKPPRRTDHGIWISQEGLFLRQEGSRGKADRRDRRRMHAAEDSGRAARRLNAPRRSSFHWSEDAQAARSGSGETMPTAVTDAPSRPQQTRVPEPTLCGTPARSECPPSPAPCSGRKPAPAFREPATPSPRRARTEVPVNPNRKFRRAEPEPEPEARHPNRPEPACPRRFPLPDDRPNRCLISSGTELPVDPPSRKRR